MSSIQLTGDKDRVVKRVQKRLDEYDRSCKAYEAARNRLDACGAENVQLADIPAHEARYQHLLSEFKQATDNLKHAAERVSEKTDEKHIHKYFKSTTKIRSGDKKYYDIHYGFKKPLEKLHDVVKQIAKTDYQSQITQAQNASQIKVQEAQAAIEWIRRGEEAAQEYSLIDRTFPSCSDKLNRENPAEYLRQSTLYQNKLLEKQDAATALAFGKSWIKSLPKEATWEQVEDMSFLMLAAADKTDNPGLTEYRAAVEQWFKEHPLPENTDSSLTSAQSTDPVGRRTHVLGLLYLSDRLDLSPEAFQVYQNCSRLYPDEHVWKSAQAYYYISTRQLSEAEQLLTDLPKDDPSVARALTYLAETQLVHKVDQVYERISNHQLLEADQLIADLPQNDSSVIQAQAALNTRRTLNQKIHQAYDHMFHGQWPEAEQLLAELPSEDISVIEAKKVLADERHIFQKVSQAYEHISQNQWTEVEQLLADLPQDHSSVMQAQKRLTDDKHTWNVVRKVDLAVKHISKLQWLEAEQLLAELPQDNPLVMQAHEMLANHQHAWNIARKVDQAVKHISQLQWLEAERLLAALPQDDTVVIEAKKDFSHALNERLLSSGFDIGTLLFSRLTTSSFRETFLFDATQTGLQLLSYAPARRIWTSLILRAPRPSFHVPLRAGILMAGDIGDFIFRNISPFQKLQKYENVITSLGRTAHIGWTLVSTPEQRSALSYLNAGSSLISSLQSFDEMWGTRRSPRTQALCSTLQKVASDVFAVSSQADLFPLARDRTHSYVRHVGLDIPALAAAAATEETEENSKKQWFLAAIGIGSIAAYHFYFDYPYLWAANVMKEAEWYFSQGKYDETRQTFNESEKSYFVSAARPAVQTYGNYLRWLMDKPEFLENPEAYEGFLKRLNAALVALNKSSYYRGIRNHLLVKKAEVAIQKQNAEMLSEVVKEKPADQVIKRGFNDLLSHAFHLALIDPAKALAFLNVMRPSVPSRLHPVMDSLQRLIQDQSTALQEWSKLNLLDLMLKSPSSEKVQQWDDAFQQLQIFFYKHMGKTGIFHQLQCYKLIISLAHGEDTNKTEALFKQSSAEAQKQFSQILMRFVKEFRKAGASKDVSKLLKRVRFNGFKDIELVQNYGHFFLLLYSPHSQREAVLEQMQVLERCLVGLDENDKESRVFFSACRIILNLDIGEPAKAQALLADEHNNSQVPSEAATLLFERMHVLMEEKGVEKALTLLRSIATLGPWQHQELFKTFEAYLLCDHYSPEIHLRHLTEVIAQLKGIEQLSLFAHSLQHEKNLPEFQLYLSQEKLQEAKGVLNGQMSKKLYDEVCKLLFMYLINRGEQLRQTNTLRNTRETIQRLGAFFSAQDAGRIQCYGNFLAILENLQESREIAVHQQARQSLNIVFNQLRSIHFPIPESLRWEMSDILSKTALLARVAGQLRTALEAYESIRQLGMGNEFIEQSIQGLREQLTSR